jgi:hypothetical protein
MITGSREHRRLTGAEQVSVTFSRKDPDGVNVRCTKASVPGITVVAGCWVGGRVVVSEKLIPAGATTTSGTVATAVLKLGFLGMKVTESI